MFAKRLEHFERLLKQERARINAVLERIAVASPSAGADSGAPGDDADAGVSGVGPDDDAAIIARETAALHEVDEALHRLQESPHDYGICVQCGRPIPDERLELLPATRLCGRGGLGIRR
jgi:RNA polymerase-binding transcription factor DksA